MNNTHQMKLNDLPFNLIKKGLKIIEVRLLDEKRQLLKIGDQIVFTNLKDSNKKLTVTIIQLFKFKSFNQLFKNISPKDIGFYSSETEEEMINCYYNFYTKEEEIKYGVLAIKIKA